MTKAFFLLANLALAFYNVGTIWAHEVDIFRTWRLLDPKTFTKVQSVHWKKLSFWVFIPVGLSFIGSIALFWYRPASVPPSGLVLAFVFLASSNILTGAMWGPWQAKLSKEDQGGESRYLKLIVRTHWIRTFLINAYGFTLLYLTARALAGR